MEMYVLRVSLVPQDPELFKRENKHRDIRIFEESLLHTVTNSQLYGPLTNEDDAKYSLKITIKPDNNGVMGGVVSRAKKLHGHDAEFNEYDIDDFPPLLWLWDREEQVILVEKKTKVFKTATNAAKAFQKITNNIVLAEEGFRVDIEPVLKDCLNDFWHEYDNLEFVERIEFELIPPNLFGETEKAMKKALLDISEQTNATKIKTVLENSGGNLKLSSKSWIGNAIRWIKKGGGSWVMRGRRTVNSKGEDISSGKSAKLIVLNGQLSEAQLDGYSCQELADFISHIRPEYTYKDNKNED